MLFSWLLLAAAACCCCLSAYLCTHTHTLSTHINICTHCLVIVVVVVVVVVVERGMR